MLTKIIVMDSGIRTPPEDQDKLFETFSQVEVAACQHEGVLGLPSSHELAMLLDRYFTYRRGRTFTMTILEK
jgi:signal transduction histidine kinase